MLHGLECESATECAEGFGKPTVQVLSKLFGPQSQNLQNAMDKTSQRHNLLAKNLANVNVPGYKREDIDFAVELEGEENKPGQKAKSMQNSLSGGSKSDSAIRIDGNNVDLEFEVMTLAEAEMRYQMLSELTSRYFNGLQTAIREGK